MKKFRVAILTHTGAKRLIDVLSTHEDTEIAAIVLERPTRVTRGPNEWFRRSVRYDGYLATLKKLLRQLNGSETGAMELQAAAERQADLKMYVEEKNIPIYEVGNYHDEEALKLLRGLDLDLGILYGTNIIKEPVFSIPALGMINLHQGLAPYYRGGPTVFWELFNGESQLGITIHFVAPKVDTGDIILQRTIPLEYDFQRYDLDYDRFLTDYRLSLRELSIAMISEAVKLVSNGTETRIKQDISLGKRYRLPTKREKDALLKRLKKRRSELAHHGRSDYQM